MIDAIGMLYALIVQFPDLENMLRPVIAKLEDYRDSLPKELEGRIIDV